MKFRPVFTEKSIKLAKAGGYTFWVLPSLTKNQIKSLFEKALNVKIKLIKTLNYKKSEKRNFRGKIVTKPAMKKAILFLKSGKIDVFEEVKK